jgi:hypothetical protein
MRVDFRTELHGDDVREYDGDRELCDASDSLHADGRDDESGEWCGCQYGSGGLTRAVQRIESVEPKLCCGNKRDSNGSGDCGWKQLRFVDGMRIDLGSELYGCDVREYDGDGELRCSNTLCADCCHDQSG